MKYTVYMVSPVGEYDIDKYYIGVTCDIERRWCQHRNYARNGVRNQVIYQEMRKQECMITPLAEFTTDYEAYAYEKALRPSINTGWNMNGGGDTEFACGEPVWYNGVEYKSLKNMAECMNIDWKTAMKILAGEETFTKPRDRKVKPKNLKPVVIIDAKTGEETEYVCLSEAWEAIGRDGQVSGNIAKQKSKGRPAYGYYWEYD